ncbi:acetyl-CoA carboxylase biotin carboxyl carrier protein [Thiomicrospira sp. ALE5]|uniref:acetyl-CoA carboxylase biotin carboxyl carrier protein n=1 Tax=Thiomicrospira sp. ALE5 TaxID=748650 RepID=UPI0008E272AB|nr:acetyl-CoA carboxylase biotin carboxyl carrier protein [Thiomicrospira sp. ALE5]SFR61095.1 acetyl-CoA carboxylase biotin carboxyl carrier protein [Thiomicrospira sp. ALE5]
MDIRSIRKLIEIVEESNIAEIEIQEGEHSVRITRNKEPVYMPTPSAMQYQAAPAPSPTPAAPPSAPSEPAAATESTGTKVTSPMVGTFYAAASPTSAPFVSVGDSVAIGDTLCIIEAMKIMNPIEAEVAGTVKQILIQNGEPVEFGQTLFIVE